MKKTPSKKIEAAKLAEEKLEQGYQESLQSSWPHAPLQKEGKSFECPICVGKLTIHGIGHLYCNNCNEYYTVDCQGELVKAVMEVEL